MTMINQALSLAAKGFFVFPCKPNTKEPSTFHGHKDATTDESIIRKWWKKCPDANIGLALKPSSLMVVDLDCHEGKPNGVKNFKEIKKGNHFEDIPPRSNTGGNGIQLFFQCPEEAIKHKLDGIDILTDGYVILPPSIHPNGSSYAWHKRRSLLELQAPACPEWLLSAISKDSFTLAEIEKLAPTEYPSASGEVLIERCPFLKHCVEDATILEEPDWYHGIVGVLSYTNEAPGIVHKYSCDYPGYDPKETDAKIKHWKKDSQGPATCKAIQNKCGDKYCQTCPFNQSIKSPIVLGYANRSPEKKQQILPFPIEALPSTFQDFSVTAAKALQCPLDYIGCSLLAAASILIGGKRRIQLEPEWEQQGNLWIALVGSPSSKKSPALDKALSNIRIFEQQLYSDYQQAFENYELQLHCYEAELREWKNNKASEKAPVKPKKPILQRLTTSDSTVEALGELLSANSAGVALVCDELSAWMRSMNQYKGGRGADRSHYLAMWSNAQMTIDRKSKEPLIVPSPYLSIIGGIQPNVLSEISDYGIEDGMKERFLFCCPPPNRELPTTGLAIPEELHEELSNSLENLFNNRPEQELTISLSKMARNAFLEARQEWHRITIEPDFPAEMEAYYVKMSNYLGRLALILHEMKRATGKIRIDMVSETTMLEAKALADYFLNHAHLALGMLQQSREGQRVEKAVAWLKKKHLTLVSPRDLLTNKVSGCLKASEARMLLKAIHDYGYGYWDKETGKLLFFQDSVSNSA